MLSKLNKFILLYFPDSRLYTYDSIVYMINDIDNEIIAFSGLNIFDNNILISQLCVHNNYRNNGIASTLLNFIQDNFHNSNFILYIGKNNNNTESLYQFYKNRGFIEDYNDYIKYKMIKNNLNKF